MLNLGRFPWKGDGVTHEGFASTWPPCDGGRALSFALMHQSSLHKRVGRPGIKHPVPANISQPRP